MNAIDKFGDKVMINEIIENKTVLFKSIPDSYKDSFLFG